MRISIIALVVAFFFITSSNYVHASVLQKLPWKRGNLEEAAAMVTDGVVGYSESCDNHHADPEEGKIDFKLSSTDDVLAAEKGSIVEFVSDCEGEDESCGSYWGNHIIIKHTTSRYTVYAHLSSVTSGLALNNSVHGGSVLGKAGDTGNADGVHLHFERWSCSTQSCSTYPLFFEGTEQVFPNSAGRLVCGDYISKNSTCAPPDSGDWIVEENCIISGEENFDFENNKIVVKDGFTLRIEDEGKLY